MTPTHYMIYVSESGKPVEGHRCDDSYQAASTLAREMQAKHGQGAVQLTDDQGTPMAILDA